MCDFSGRLVAWVDGELPDDEAADVEQHVRHCSECGGCVAAYGRVSHAFAAYCEARSTETRGQMPHWVPVLSSAVAAVVLLVVFVLQTPVFRPVSVKTIPAGARVVDASRAVLHDAAPGPVEKVHRRHLLAHNLVAPKKTPRTTWEPPEPAIQIAIPAESMFPPGAVPEGTTFIANLRMSADGSVERLRLQ